jgi:hypothetical protein
VGLLQQEGEAAVVGVDEVWGAEAGSAESRPTTAQGSGSRRGGGDAGRRGERTLVPLDTALAPSILSVSGFPVRRRERKKLPTTTAWSIPSPAAPNFTSPAALLTDKELFFQ